MHFVSQNKTRSTLEMYYFKTRYARMQGDNLLKSLDADSYVDSNDFKLNQ